MLNLQVLTGKFSEVLVYPKNSEKTGALVDSPTKSVEFQMVSDLNFIKKELLLLLCIYFCLHAFAIIVNSLLW